MTRNMTQVLGTGINIFCSIMTHKINSALGLFALEFTHLFGLT